MFNYVSSFSPEGSRPTAKTSHRSPNNTLKAELIKHTAALEQRKLQPLISGEELGNRKPTPLLRRMQQLLGDHTAEANTTFL